MKTSLLLLREPGLGTAEREVLDRGYQDAAFRLFRELLTAPGRYVVRVNENASVQEQNLRIEVRMHLSFPGRHREELSKPGRNNNVLIPLLTLRKDTVADGLEFLPVGGQLVDSWQQREAKGLLLHTVQEFFYAAYTEDSSLSPAGLPELTVAQQDALAMVLELVGSTGPYRDEELAAVIAALESLPVAGAPGAGNAAEALRDLCTRLAKYAVIVVEVPFDNRLLLGYSQYRPVLQNMRRWRLSDLIRLLLGSRPTRFIVPISLPFRAPSYHFSLSGIPDQYVEKECLLDLETNSEVTPEDYRVHKGGAQVIVRKPAGRPASHIYLRNFRSVAPFRLGVKVEFAEVPPGILGAAVMVSLITSALIAFFALASPNSGTPALLLALPAFAASWLGITPGGESLLRCSLAARVGLMASAACALIAVLLFLLGKAVRHPVLSLPIVGHVGVWWAVLAAVALGTSGYLLDTFFRRFRAYLRALNTRLTQEGDDS